MSSSRVNPTVNLLKTFGSVIKNFADPIKSMNDLLELPKDEHGNILIGVDGENFEHWNGYLKDIMPFKILGPIIIPTDTRLISAILNQIKINPLGFTGNASSLHIADLTGTDNIFAADDPFVHASHKQDFKSYLHDHQHNVTIISPVINRWLQEIINSDKYITDENIELLTSRIMVGFLFNVDAVNCHELITAVIAFKKHFIDLATKNKFASDDEYLQAKYIINNHLYELCDSLQYSYPRFLLENDRTRDEIISHITSLLMVGFDNLRSAFGSLLVNLASHPSVRSKLVDEVQSINGIPFIQFDPAKVDKSNNMNTSKYFFKEATRLVPPVWLQARKNGNAVVDINYTNENNQTVTFAVHPRSTILIPIFHLARKLLDGDKFSLSRQEQSALPLPFSTGPNACPGRNIAYAATGVLLGEIITRGIGLKVKSALHFSPKVSLTLENISLKIKPIADLPGADIDLLPQRVSSFTGNLWNRLSTPLLGGISGGLIAAVFTYYETQSLMHAVGAATVSAGLLWKYLEFEGGNDNTYGYG